MPAAPSTISTTTPPKPTDHGPKRRWLEAPKPKTAAETGGSTIGPLTTHSAGKRGTLGATDPAPATDSPNESEEDILANARKRRRRLATSVLESTSSRQPRSTRAGEGRVTHRPDGAEAAGPSKEPRSRLEDEGRVAGTAQVADEDQMADKSEVVGQADVTNESETGDEETEVSPLVKHTPKPEKIKSWEDSGKDIPIGKIVPCLSYDEDDPALADQGPADEQESKDEQRRLEVDGLVIMPDPVELARQERLRSMKKAKEELQKSLEQMDPDLLRMAYQFFKHDESNRSINVEDRVHQDGARRPYQQHQAYAIFWIMWSERGRIGGKTPKSLGGGILGDEPGFGKVSLVSSLPSGPFTDPCYLCYGHLC